ncbi:Cobalamin synthase [Pseudoalteromonas luteoviolacea B = ATCC 29581]|nr:Cobalamin synthase [Pseudoalteromonas luteoviolacea B = ATCC 29581]
MNFNVQHFKLATIFLTRLPVKVEGEVNDYELNESSGYFALVGLLIGLLLSLSYVALSSIFPTDISIALVLAIGLLLTGAFHEDGFADVWDGFGGGWSHEDKLSIMKDSRLGTYGAAALMILLLVKYLSLVALTDELWPVLVALVLGHVLSRAFATSLIQKLKYVQADALSKVKPIAKKLSRDSEQLLWYSAFITVIVLWFVTPLSMWFFAGLIVLLSVIRFLCSLWFKKQLGGYTGDCLGAAQQLNEVAVYLYFVALWQ